MIYWFVGMNAFTSSGGSGAGRLVHEHWTLELISSGLTFRSAIYDGAV